MACFLSLLLLAVPLLVPFSLAAYTPRFSNTDFDSYGLKIAGNDFLAVQVVNNPSGQSYIKAFLSYEYPYGDRGNSTAFCAWYADETAGFIYNGAYTFFIYGIAVGSRDSAGAVVYWGENNYGSWEDKNNGINNRPAQMSFSVIQGPVINDPISYTCNYYDGTTGTASGVPYLAPITVSLDHEEFYQAAVTPNGGYSIALAQGFGFIWRLVPLVSSPSYIWSTDNSIGTNPFTSNFGPRAMALETNWGIVAGWMINSATKEYTPTVFLFTHSLNSFSVVDQWTYTPSATAWQIGIKVSDAGSWLPQHDIGVAIRDDHKVAIGLQQYNSVFLFHVNTSLQLSLIGQKSKTAKMIGFGKTVSFTANNRLQVLSNSYHSDYTNPDDSSVELYDVPYGESTVDTWSESNTPYFVYPNPNQALSIYLQPTFISAISTPSNLYILDASTSGTIFFVQPAQPGYYQPTDTSYESQRACPAGQYSNETSYESCTLCGSGYFNDGLLPAERCTVCAVDTFCPLGAVTASDALTLTPMSQAFIYPSNPEAIIFDDIMIHNLFQLQGGSCTAVSPVFWGLIVLAVNMLILGCMLRLRYCVNDAKSRKIRKLTKFVFTRADLVREGEHWVGGLASLIVLVFITMGIWFTGTYINQYPFETAPDPGFACHTQYNAKFDSSMRSVALPPDEAFEPMYEMLSEQPLELTLDVINTQLACADILIEWVRALNTDLTPLHCTSENFTTSLTVALPSHTTNIRFTFTGAQLIGAFRLTISGEAESAMLQDRYYLREMESTQAFYSVDETLQKAITVPISLIKVINQTEPLVNGDPAEVVGIWLPVFPTATESFFMSGTDYQLSQSSAFVFDIEIAEGAFWIRNVQSPIVRSAEAAFKTLLYVMMLLEVLGLLFLLCKLVQPFAHCCALKMKKKSTRKVWDRHDSSDEADGDWIDDILDTDNRIRPLVSTTAEKTSARAGLRPMSEQERQERASARQHRLEAKQLAQQQAVELGQPVGPVVQVTPS